MLNVIIVFSKTLVNFQKEFRGMKQAQAWTNHVMKHGITKKISGDEAIYFPPSRIYEVKYHRITK